MQPSEEKGSASPAAVQAYDPSVESLGKDLAATIVPEHAQDVDAAAERRVLRKLDLFLIPWMWVGYGFVYYDKVCSLHNRRFVPYTDADLPRPSWAAQSSSV